MRNESLKDIAIKELLLQLADDDFIHSYRGAEWLGLAPHIEEDVASASISQDTMGHAAIYYKLLDELGEGDADKLAHDRPAKERRNAIILELVNGPGHYMKDPDYDWAFAVVRNYFYTQAKAIKVQSLHSCSYEPLAEVAQKVQMELYYHLMHWKTWFVQLLGSGHLEAVSRMKAAIGKTMPDFAGVFSLGQYGEEMVELGLIEGEAVLQKKWIEAITPIFESVGLAATIQIGMARGDGRNGQHTEDLEKALETLSEVYASDKAASW
ncbi:MULTISPECIES: 1,2-phenylacetyl-CoA epoxidase subunit PaaC [Peribacillus]|jgi:ring-1,2-phenylacetyl-CoA epoxidase subunit PaaC|uniref:1,2-phenylacetyl-CoA epoxidase subunit PaaC n=1 Tax=Peribacillus TaxID=2675229 RepID=UPI00070A9056|nr:MULTISPECIES: 1,2-phenylacetyl-CoA epoxidase subunit PaaC [Peribacillus]KRF60043.1 phenylacetate-CoA oxygenase [Bacillus sp. Soil745]PAW30974.1 phenylacetate-CoA oxygenase subunit PaaI [Peribacillus simplex]MCY8937937.1 phenylacetate-CoA oxygenase subunit PaaC [Peribacillus frigoritolerans]MCY9003983.1 phenylacetate-CoA oxygenase subunit PaaC [Peribacillus frigoritolerans]MCZ0871899.1 phenylacetate-CoA oxygenase subunit PaaC [Peribacillus sp. AS_2]